jgi:hypothetical protein
MVGLIGMSTLLAIFVAGMTWWRTERERERLRRKADQLEARINAEMAAERNQAPE